MINSFRAYRFDNNIITDNIQSSNFIYILGFHFPALVLGILHLNEYVLFKKIYLSLSIISSIYSKFLYMFVLMRAARDILPIR